MPKISEAMLAEVKANAPWILKRELQDLALAVRNLFRGSLDDFNFHQDLDLVKRYLQDRLKHWDLTLADFMDGCVRLMVHEAILLIQRHQASAITEETTNEG